MKGPTTASIALHLALLSVFLIGARFQPRTSMGLGPGDFTPVTLVTPEMLPAKAPAAPPRPKPVERAPEPVKPVTPELKPEKDPGIKIADEPKKKPQKARPDSARTVAAAPAAAAAPAPSTPSTPVDPSAADLAGVPDAPAGNGGSVAAGMEGGGGGGGGGFGDYAYYRIAMQNRIASNWSPGFVSGEATCVVYFRIIRSGMVVGARVEKPSGIPYYDQSALRAVLESSPLPPLPAQFPEDAVGVHFRFRYAPGT
jgi:protein TonB